MKKVTCRYCGSTMKFDWEQGEMPHCQSCGAVFNRDDVYDENDEEAEAEFQAYCAAKLEQFRIKDKIKNFKNKLEWRGTITGVIVVALSLVISFGSFNVYKRCYDWYKECNTPLEIQKQKYLVTYNFTYNGVNYSYSDYVPWDQFDEDKYELVGTVTDVFDVGNNRIGFFYNTSLQEKDVKTTTE